METKQSALDSQAAIWVFMELLPSLVRDAPTFKKWEKDLKQGCRELLRNPAYNVPTNFGGIKGGAESTSSDGFLSAMASKMGSEYSEYAEAYRRTQGRARAYVSEVEDLATRLRLGESYGPALIHSLIYWAVVSPGHYWPPAIHLKPVRLSLEIKVSPLAQYSPDDIPGLPNPVASSYPKGEPLPNVSWKPKGTDGTHFGATATVRDLPDLRKVLDALVSLLERDSGLRLSKPRSGAYQHLRRNTEWFCLNRCKRKSASKIYKSLLSQGDPHPPDVFTIQKGIDQVRQLLSSIRAS